MYLDGGLKIPTSSTVRVCDPSTYLSDHDRADSNFILTGWRTTGMCSGLVVIPTYWTNEMEVMLSCIRHFAFSAMINEDRWGVAGRRLTLCRNMWRSSEF